MIQDFFSYKIIMILLVMVFLLLLVGYFTFITTSNLQKVSKAIMKENVSSLKAAEELELAIVNQKGLVSSYFLDNNHTWLETLEEKKRDFDLWLKKAQEVALTMNEKIILEDIFALYKIYNNQRNQAISLYQSGNIIEAKKILLYDVRKSIDNLYQKCEELILANEALIARAEVSSKINASTMTGLIWTSIILTLCLGASLGFFVARKINEQLVLSAKMASLGQLSATVAHEIRNPLTSIKMRLYSLEEELRDALNLKEDVNVISEEIDRLEKIVQDFLDVARPPELNLQRCNVNTIAESTVTLISAKAISQNVIIEKRFETIPFEVAVDKGQIRQVFLNIMLNAVESMVDGGVLEITTEKNKDRKCKDVLEIKFKDTGAGIPTDYKKKVCEPFFTTKSKGTGLGLFIASRIIKMHKGTMEIKSQPAKGTTVSIVLPIV
ncbi:MAG: ATP-binding protein [bacterium]